MSPQLEWLLLLVLIALSAFFSGIETGTVSINRFRLDHLVRRRNRKAVYIRHMLDHPDQLLGTTLVGNNIVNTAMPVLATAIAIRSLGPDLGPWVSGFFMMVCILIIGEYLPKAWFQSHPIKRVLPMAGMLRFFNALFRPVTITLAWISRHVIPAPQGDGAARKEWLTREHLEYVLSPESGATPTLPDQKRRVIAGILNLAGKPCRTLMKSRKRLVAIRDTMRLDEILAVMRAQPYDQYPVWSEKSRRFTGILDAREVIRGSDRPNFILGECIRPPQFVDETLAADQLLPRMRLSRQPMLLITRSGGDEVVGFVTMELLLEQIIAPLYE